MVWCLGSDSMPGASSDRERSSGGHASLTEAFVTCRWPALRPSGPPAGCIRPSRGTEPVACKLNQFDRSTIVDDHGDPNTRRRRTDIAQECHALDCFIDIIDLKGNVRHRADKVGDRTPFVKSHPFDSERTCCKPGHREFQVFEMELVRPGNGGRNPEVMIAPAAPGDGFGRFVILSFSRHSALRMYRSGLTTTPLHGATDGRVWVL